MSGPDNLGRRFVYAPGFFKHDQLPTGPDKGFRAHTFPEFGILDRSYGTNDPGEPALTQWQRFEKHIRHLNAADPQKDQYRVLLVARHGEGVHNVKERESKWARLEGDGTTTWLDARLTEKGEQQARDLSGFWKEALEVSKVPAPDRHYTSPLTRCLQTARLTFADVPLPSGNSFRPIVKEALREIHGVHTCDKRSSRDEILSQFPEFALEPGFSDEDELWKPDHRETLEERIPLMRQFLHEVFQDAESTFISLTTHSGAIRALYKAIGHPDVWVAAGAVVPIVVRSKSSA
ncbi:hypothetical protein PRZ48_007649 [Zasmidium cellare]|uniref:Phosphoglycerate mutase n=1 Tax=Zasmidium cellare TaxID=395010 RepID=A0ABR0EL01_ZASCE|nr:hypothetical protein PRZ48_007649 [Zasmidium cellare]